MKVNIGNGMMDYGQGKIRKTRNMCQHLPLKT